MIIAVNTRLLLKDKLEGIGWFTYETLKRITAANPGHRFIFIFDRPFDPQFVFPGNVTPVVVSPPARHPVLWYLWFDIQLPRILKKYRADLFLSPDGYLSRRTKVPQLAVIHDINFVHRPKDLPLLASKYLNRFFPQFARIARRIATVSEYSKADICRSFGITPEKIDVVYNGINTLFTPTSEAEQAAARQQFSGGDPFFLFVGALNPRKNIAGLLRAFEQFCHSSETRVKLLIVGGKMYGTGEIFQVWQQMHFRGEVIFTGRLSAKDLHQVLGAARALVFVPFFEGFGIPVIEAMSAGVPVICSNVTSLPEVGGEAVCYVDPARPGEIAQAMLKVSSDEALRREMIRRGFQRKELFSWELTAQKLWECMEKTVR